jgi:hypothetical protein
VIKTEFGTVVAEEACRRTRVETAMNKKCEANLTKILRINLFSYALYVSEK